MKLQIIFNLIIQLLIQKEIKFHYMTISKMSLKKMIIKIMNFNKKAINKNLINKIKKFQTPKDKNQISLIYKKIIMKNKIRVIQVFINKYKNLKINMKNKLQRANMKSFKMKVNMKSFKMKINMKKNILNLNIRKIILKINIKKIFMKINMNNKKIIFKKYNQTLI